MRIKVHEFFTWATVLTLGGSVTVTVLVTDTVGALLGRFGTDAARRWIAFVLALACAYAAAVYATTGHRHLHGYEWLLAFINACLIWSSAFGLNQTAVSMKGVSLQKSDADKTHFFRSWT